MNTKAIKNLASATLLRAAKDYTSTKETKRKDEILADLRSKWMDFFTNGMSVIVAEQLEKHPAEISARLRQYKEEEI